MVDREIRFWQPPLPATTPAHPCRNQPGVRGAVYVHDGVVAHEQRLGRLRPTEQAQRLGELDPESSEAASLLRKVGERMAWDAEAALQAGPPGDAERLLRQCLELVPDHPRCLAVAESL